MQIVSVELELTTQQAADLLRVSRPYLVKLLDAGKLPYKKTGPRHRLRQDDILAYQERLDVQRRQAL